MSYESGQTSDWIDLANRLRLFLTGGSGIVNVQYSDGASGSAVGNGKLTAYSLGASAVNETFTLTCTAAAVDGGTFSVVGSVSGALADATVGVAYTSAYVNFTITSGTTDWAVGDTITFDSYFSAISNPWTQLAWTPGDVTAGGMNLSVRGPGAAADKRVFINIRSDHSDADNRYSWDVRGATDFVAGSTFGTHPGELPWTVYLLLWKQPMNYWFYANDRRFIVVVKVNTQYFSLYAGFFLPWATPEQYPFPLYIGGSCGWKANHLSTDSSVRSMVDPSGSSSSPGGWVRGADGVWYGLRNHESGSANDAPLCGNRGNDGFVWPYQCSNVGSSSGTSGFDYTVWNYGGSSAADGGVADHLEATAQGQRLLCPIYLMRGQEPAGFGALDGVYFPMGGGLTPEQTATYGGRSFRAFPNVFRISCNDFFMVEQN